MQTPPVFPNPFPDPENTTPEGIVAIGEDYRPETLQCAYRQGIFPWPHEGYPLLWFCPPHRALLDFTNMQVPPRLRRLARNTGMTFTLDHAFTQVITACQNAPRPQQAGTWITSPMLAAYCELHQRGIAHSVEAWSPAGELVGGLYGVDGGGVFSGESMFHTLSNASKLALLFLVEHLQTRGLDFIDIQQLTPHMKALGAYEVTRHQFLRRLRETQAKNLVLFPSLHVERASNSSQRA